MTKIPFTVYDIFAYLLSGGTVVATLDFVFGNKWILKAEKSPLIALFLVVLAYISGHLIAHFSSLFLETILVDRILKRPSRTLMASGLGSDQVNCLIELIISKKERLILSLEHHF